MTKEEAVIILDGFKNNPLFSDTHAQAFDMAISALSEKKGEWKRTYLDHVAMGERPSILYCSACCQCIAYPTNFCPNCGADMREPKDILHKAIDNTTFAEEAYPNIKEELHKAVDMAEPKGEKGTE